MTDTAPKPFVFVLMPFSEAFDDVYKLGIKPACNNAGAYAERVDEQIYQDSILQRIYNQITKADIIVADMTGRNPNVFYETGYAHALGKHVILLTQNSEDIPFDLKHYPHIIYGGKISELLPELEKRVRWAVENPEISALQEGSQIQFYIDGNLLINNPIIEHYTQRAGWQLWLKIDLNNSIENLIQTSTFRLGLITSARFQRSGEDYDGPDNKVARLPDGGTMHLYSKEMTIFPGEWDSFTIVLDAIDSGKTVSPGDEESFVLRMFSKIGVWDYPFCIKITDKSKAKS